MAEGVAVAMRRARRPLPLVVRFAGNNADFARMRLKDAGVKFTEAKDVADAVARVMALVAKDGA